MDVTLEWLILSWNKYIRVVYASDIESSSSISIEKDRREG